MLLLIGLLLLLFAHTNVYGPMPLEITLVMAGLFGCVAIPNTRTHPQNTNRKNKTQAAITPHPENQRNDHTQDNLRAGLILWATLSGTHLPQNTIQTPAWRKARQRAEATVRVLHDERFLEQAKTNRDLHNALKMALDILDVATDLKNNMGKKPSLTDLSDIILHIQKNQR